jgi:hypothetical protein
MTTPKNKKKKNKITKKHHTKKKTAKLLCVVTQTGPAPHKQPLNRQFNP